MALAFHRGAGDTGTYHFSGTPDVSWADFAREIFAQADLQLAVTEIPSAARPTAAARPENSRLDCSGLTEVFGIARPDWRKSLAGVLQEINNL